MAQLQRTLGPVLIWGLGVGYVISGMYFGWNLGLPEGGPYGMLVATGIVTILYISFVLGYAELACALPRAGGAFVYTSRAFGPDVGFFGGIAQLVEYMLAPPAVAFAIGAYINQTNPDVPILLVAVIAYVLFTAVNIWGVKLSVSFELVLTVIAVVELLVFGIVVLPEFSWEKFSIDPLPNGWGKGVIAALPFAMWFYLAIEGIANVAEDARNPQRDLPRGFLWAMATLVGLTAITLLGAVGASGWHSVVYLDPSNTKSMSDSPLPLAVGHVISRDSPLFTILTGIGLVGLVASFHGILIAGSRAIMEFGRAGYAPKIVGEVHAGTKTPVAALIGNLIVGLITLATGKTSDIILIAVMGALTLYILSSAAVIQLRRTEPQLKRPYKAPLYPVTPVIACGLSIVCLGSMVWAHPKLALIYDAILVGCWGLFRAFVPPEKRMTF
jgi:ethanolamine permease